MRKNNKRKTKKDFLDINEILITLQPDKDGNKVNKNDVFSVVALANGWQAKVKKQVQKEAIVEGKNEADRAKKANAKFEELKNEVKGFGFLGSFIDPNNKNIEILKYTEEVEIDNPITEEEFGKNILVQGLLKTYGEAKIKVETQQLQEQLQNKQKEVFEELNNIETPKVD